MQPKYTKNRIIDNTNVCGNIYKISIEGSFNIKPGQFFMLRSWDNEPLLARPISVFDATDSSVSFLYEVRGEGTRLLEKLTKNDEIELLGPLGNGFDIDRIGGKVAVITGGIGIAPMLYTVKNIKNAQVDLYAGFRDTVYGINEFDDYVENKYISTDLGTEGHRGFVTDLFNPLDYNLVLCCGPRIMMDKVIKICAKCATPVYVSMESHMACGIGACLVCSCETVNGIKRTCKDGPVFYGRDVVIDDAC